MALAIFFIRHPDWFGLRLFVRRNLGQRGWLAYGLFRYGRAWIIARAHPAAFNQRPGARSYDLPQSKATASKPLGLIDAAKVCFAKPSFWYLSLGAASSSMVGYGLLYWMPTFLARSLHMDIVSRSYFLAALLFIAGIIGMSLGGVLADYFGKKSKSAYALIPAIAFILSVPLFYFGVTAKTPMEAFLYFLVPQTFALMWLGPVLSAVQHLGPAQFTQYDFKPVFADQ